MTMDMLTALSHVNRELGHAEAQQLPSGEPEPVLVALAEVRDLGRRLGLLESYLERAAVRAMPASRYERPGLFAERWRGPRRYSEWDHAAVARRLLDAAPSRQVSTIKGLTNVRLGSQDTVNLLLRAARPVWRTSVLRGLGVDIEGLATVVKTPPRVTVVRHPIQP